MDHAPWLMFAPWLMIMTYRYLVNDISLRTIYRKYDLRG